MMKNFRILILLPLLGFIFSCQTLKEVKYLQPNENLALNEQGLIPYNITKYRVTKQDVLRLMIITTPKGDAAQFYSSLYTQNTTGENNSYSTGLRLDDNGDVEIFGIGKIKAEGRTTDEIAAEIQDKVNYNFLPGKSEVRVFLDGIKYTILYDTEGKSGQKTAKVQSISIIDAIAENGGLDKTIDRKNVIIYRKFPEGIKKAQLDLTREDIQNSPYFWIQNGDTIMFNTKAKSFYGFGKEPLQTLTTGVTLVTTALSIYLLLSKL